MAVLGNNKKLTQLLLKRNAKVFYTEGKWRDNSPFFQAINNERLWAMEMFCDNGANPNTSAANGQSALIYAALNGHFEIALYLSLRTRDIDQEDIFSGKNTLVMFLLNKDLFRA